MKKSRRTVVRRKIFSTYVSLLIHGVSGIELELTENSAGNKLTSEGIISFGFSGTFMPVVGKRYSEIDAGVSNNEIKVAEECVIKEFTARIVIAFSFCDAMRGTAGDSINQSSYRVILFSGTDRSNADNGQTYETCDFPEFHFNFSGDRPFHLNPGPNFLLDGLCTYISGYICLLACPATSSHRTTPSFSYIQSKSNFPYFRY